MPIFVDFRIYIFSNRLVVQKKKNSLITTIIKIHSAQVYLMGISVKVHTDINFVIFILLDTSHSD